MSALVEKHDAGVILERGGDGVVVLRSSAAEPAPAGWRQRLRDVMRSMPDVAAVGARRHDGTGRLFSMGEMLVHPKGFHHVGQGLEPHTYRFAEEVDSVCGGVLAMDGPRFEAIDGAAVIRAGGDSALGWCELCLRLRREGGRIVTVPDVLVEDTRTVTHDPGPRAAFHRRLGFDPLLADLEEVRRLHAGTGILWNLRLHGPQLPYDKYRHRGGVHWESYRTAAPYRMRANHIVRVVSELAGGGPVLDVGCGDGLFAHLLAAQGLEVTGLEPDPIALEHAHRAAGDADAAAPRFVRGRGQALPFPAGSFATVLMLDVIEHLSNPVAVLRECRRVLAPGGHLLITTPAAQYGAWSDPSYHVCEFTEEELVALVRRLGGLDVATTGRIGGVYRDIVLVARRSL